MITQKNIGLAILFTIISCGIYSIYWMLCINDDVNQISRRNGASGVAVILLSIVTCGIYGIYWMYTMGNSLDNTRMENGRASGNLSILCLVLTLFGFGIVAYAIIQNEINSYTNQSSNPYMQ